MDASDVEFSQLVQPVSLTESQPLLPSLEGLTRITIKERLAAVSLSPRKLCLPSKSAVVILLWSLLVGAIYMTAKGGVNYATSQLGRHDHKLMHSIDILLARFVFVLVFLLYPFAGFLADVRYGRHKVLIASLCLLACGMALLSFDSILLFTGYAKYTFRRHGHHGVVLYYIAACGGLIFLVLGFAGYEANFIQFGIDQLVDAPSEYLGLFVHWVTWFIMLGTTFAQLNFSLLNHCYDNVSVQRAIQSLPLVSLALLVVLLAASRWKRHWFIKEPARSNPYRTVVKVLNFARRHRHPIGHSDVMYDEHTEPTRMDFAKERYGGPFTTEQVEDVKTFLRILVILLALGPVFACEVIAGPVLPIFIQHIIKQSKNQTTCSVKEVMIDTDSIKSVATAVLFPVYVWLIYSIMRGCIPKTFTRITVGIAILVAGLICMFSMELLAHLLHHKHHKYGVRCMFTKIEKEHYKRHLALPWPVTIAPGFLIQTGITLVVTTTFEFISAQSPHAMKGLLIGVMFAVRGIFQLLMAAAVLPFSVKEIWGTERMKKHPPPVTNCGFGYLLLTCVVGGVGLVLFLVATKRYKYRERISYPSMEYE